jgi:hypothetical protein
MEKERGGGGGKSGYKDCFHSQKNITARYRYVLFQLRERERERERERDRGRKQKMNKKDMQIQTCLNYCEKIIDCFRQKGKPKF